MLIFLVIVLRLNLKKIADSTGVDGKKYVEMMVPFKDLSNFWRNLEMRLINQAATFAITDTKLYVPVVTLSTQDNAKLFQQLKSGFKRRINWNKYLPSVEKKKNTNVMIDGKNIFNQPVKNSMNTYNNIQKIATGQGYDYTTGCLLDYNYFKEYYNMIAIDFRKQEALDADPRAIQQINFTGNLDRVAGATMFFYY